MNSECLIKKYAIQLKASRRELDIAPDLKPKLVEKWYKKYENKLQKDIRDYILVMSYTNTGNFVLTADALYYDNYLQSGLQKVKYEEILEVTCDEGGLFSVDKVYIPTRNCKLKLDGCIDGINIHKFSQILMKLAQLSREDGNYLQTSKQGLLSYELPEELKILYLKILCNYSYINDQLIDAIEYNAIAKISIRMELGSEARTVLRKYMNSIDAREKTGMLIKKVKEFIKGNSGYWDAFRYCIMQDVILIHNIQKNDEPWTEDGFIGGLMELCQLCPEQIDTMMKAVSLNAEMQKKEADLKHLHKNWTEFLAKIRYTSAYVPGAYLFCAGSIYGKELYSSFFTRNRYSEKDVSDQRVLIMQEIMLNTEKTINVVIQDTNYLSELLENAVNESNENKEKLKKLISRLKEAQNIRTER